MGAQEMLRLHADVEGRVQGVGFRYFVMQSAMDLKLTGWVRNRWNGQVEVVAEGGRESLENLLGDLRRGPRANTSEQVQTNWETGTGEFKRFRIRRTG